MAEWLKTRLIPIVKILFTSGYTEDAIAHHGVLDEASSSCPSPILPTPSPARCAICWMVR